MIGCPSAVYYIESGCVPGPRLAARSTEWYVCSTGALMGQVKRSKGTWHWHTRRPEAPNLSAMSHTPFARMRVAYVYKYTSWMRIVCILKLVITTCGHLGRYYVLHNSCTSGRWDSHRLGGHTSYSRRLISTPAPRVMLPCSVVIAQVVDKDLEINQVVLA